MISESELMESVEFPVDLSEADTGAVLFYIAGQVPLPVEDFSRDCCQTQSEVRDILQSRFQNEVKIDQTGFISLTQAASKPLLTEASPILNKAKDAESRGKRYHDDGNSEKAAKQYRTAAILFSGVKNRLTTAGDVSDSLTERVAEVSKTHDRIQKELAEDTVTHRKMLAQHRENEGDDSVQLDDYDEAAEHFDDALLLYKGAKEAIETYNESRFFSSSEPIDSSEVDRLANAVNRKVRNAKGHAEETPETEETKLNDKTTEGNSQTQSEIDDEIQTDDDPDSDGIDEDAGSALSKENVIGNIKQYVDEHDSIPTCKEIANISSETEKELLAHFDTWNSALETADIDKQKRLIDELQDISEEVSVPPSVGQVDEHSVYTSEIYLDEFGSWADAITAAGLRNVSRNPPKENLSTEEEMSQTLQRLDEETDVFPMMNDVREKTDYTPSEYKSEFGSWNDALVAVGIDKQERLLEEIRRVRNIVGSRPSVFELYTHSSLSMGEFTKNFEDIGEVLDLALGDEVYNESPSEGEHPSKEEDKTSSSNTSTDSDEETSEGVESLATSNPTRQDYLEAIRFVADSLETAVKSADIRGQTPYSVNEITQEFGTWPAALKAADIDNETRLLTELRRVADKLGHQPSTTEMNEHGHVSAGLYQIYFRSYTEAVDQAFNDDQESENEIPSQTISVTTTVSAIEEDSRLDQPIVVQVIQSSTVNGNVKDANLRVEDIDGNQTWLNIWSKHAVDILWETGHWYVLLQARGQYWTNSDGETGRNLSSTKDLLVESIGPGRPDVETVVR